MGLSVGLFLIGGVFFSSTGPDDTHITTWAVYALGHRGEIVNYNNDKVEQSSSLLQVAVLGPIAALDLIPTSDLTPVSAIFFALVTIGMTYVLGMRMGGQFVAASAAFLTASAVYFVYWAFSGMETTLATLTMVLVILCCGNYLQPLTVKGLDLLGAALAICAALMVRPEMPIVLGCVIGGLVVVYLLQGKDAFAFVRRSFVLMGLWVVCFGTLLLFRYWYFGSWFPQPVTAKIGAITWEVLRAGLDYLYVHLSLEPVVGLEMTLALVSGAFLVWHARTRKEPLNAFVWIAILTCVTYLAFIVATGGDWMEAGRFLVPMTPIVSLMIGLSFVRIFPTQKKVRLAVGILLVLNLLTIAHFAWQYSNGTLLWSTIPLAAQFESPRYGWFERQNREDVGDMPMLYYLRQLITRLNPSEVQPLALMSGQMGMIPFHLAREFEGRVKIIDRYSLTDRALSGCALVQEVPRQSFAQIIKWNFLFDNANGLETQCGISQPDIIFDLGGENITRNFPENGYTIVFRESGMIRGSDAVFRGQAMSASEFIALRNELVSKLGEWHVAHYDFETQQVTTE